MAKSTLLEKEIEERRREIATKAYSMPVREITSMYEDGDLVISPSFQRLFRWDEDQKSKLVESILLGIPLPLFFFATTADGKMEVVDGLQRISTLLQLQGRLKKPDGGRWDPLELSGTKYLPSLEGCRWESNDPGTELTDGQKSDIRNARIDVVIINRQSDTSAKFDLFQRLNSLGSPLTAQELRQAMLEAECPDVASWIDSLAQYPPFRSSLNLSDRKIETAADREYALRFISMHNRDFRATPRVSNISDFLDDAALSLAELDDKEKDELGSIFRKTFDFFDGGLGPNSFRMWDEKTSSYKRGFSIMAFEVLALGYGYAISSGHEVVESPEFYSKKFWNAKEFDGYSSGKSAEARLSKTVDFGRELFAGLGSA